MGVVRVVVLFGRKRAGRLSLGGTGMPPTPISNLAALFALLPAAGRRTGRSPSVTC